MNDDELSDLVRTQATRYEASERLRAGIRTQVALQSAARAKGRVVQGHDANEHDAKEYDVCVPWRRRTFDWRGMIGAFAGGVALTLALGWIVPQLALRDALPAQLVAGHVRALVAGPLIEVASNDRHAVKPWFQGKLDYAPPVIDLQASGFVLLGGRVDQVQGKAAAVLAYQRDRHVVSLFVWPSGHMQAPQREQHSGFAVVHWSDGAMQMWAVSDIDAVELERFAQGWRERAQTR